MIHIIGGIPRCGKSTLYRRILSQYDGAAIELDLLKPAINYWVAPSEGHPLAVAPNIYELTPKEWFNQLREYDRYLWEGMAKHIRSLNYGKQDLLLEGASFYPDWIAELKEMRVPHKAVFLVDGDQEKFAERIKAIAKSETSSNNWQADWSDEQIERWCEYNQIRVSFIKKTGLAHGYPVFDISQIGLFQAQQLAAEMLGYEFGLPSGQTFSN
jgi:hypothetical protein